MWPTSAKRARGFTLIELLIAVAILAIISGIAYRGLSSALDTRTRLAAENQKWRELAQLMARLESDFTAAVDRPARNSYGNLRPAFLGAPDSIEETGIAVIFVRAGLPAQRSALADSQRIGYRLRDGKLLQLSWNALDQAPRAEPAEYALLDGVRGLDLRFLDANNQWQARWPQVGATVPGLPRAVEMKLTLASGESFTRMFALP